MKVMWEQNIYNIQIKSEPDVVFRLKIKPANPAPFSKLDVFGIIFAERDIIGGGLRDLLGNLIEPRLKFFCRFAKRCFFSLKLSQLFEGRLFFIPA